MKPYYDADGITLYHGDCLEIEEWLAGDVLVTDPPYGITYVSNWSKYAFTRPIIGDNDSQMRDLALRAWGDRPALIFGTWKVPRPHNTRHRLIWAKGDSPGMGDLALPWGPGEEEIYVLGDGWKGKRTSNVITVPTIPAQAAHRPEHPTPKPLPLMETLIEKSPLGVVVDPFAGSGSTLLAARNQGRTAIGVEIEELYCDLIASRLAQGVLL
jgi:DNA modification methylase